MQRISPTVNFEKLSVVLAVTMLAFSLTRFIPASSSVLQISLLNSVFDFTFDLRSLLSIVTALMAAVGSDWIISDRMNGIEKKNSITYYQHIIIPVFFALVISATLNQSLENRYWWVVFGMGSLLFALILLAEFIVKVSEGPRYTIATIALIAFSFALFMILNVALKTSNSRLYLEIFFLGIGSWIVSMRMISLRLNRGIFSQWTAIIILSILQIGAGLHYIRMNPLQFGLLSTGSLYVLLSLVCGIEEKKKRFGLFLEPLSMLVLIAIVFFLV